MTLTPKEKPVIALLAFQLVLVVALLVLDPGFDLPNSLGLDFGFVVLLFGLFVVSWLMGLILACKLTARRAVYVFGYLMSPFICFGLAALGESVF